MTPKIMFSLKRLVNLSLLLLCATYCIAQTTYGLLPMSHAQFLDKNGVPLAAGKVYTYSAGTTTPLATYTDSTGVTPNANPVILDGGGFADIWLGNGTYKIVVTDSNGVQQWSVDNVSNFGQLLKNQGAVVSSPNGGAQQTITGPLSATRFISGSTNPAGSGIVRLASGDTACWRNNANNADICLSKDASDVFHFANGLTLDSGNLTITAGTVTGAKFAGGVANNGTGFQHSRFGASCTTIATAGAACSTTYTWPTPFADTNYTAVCSIDGGSSGVPVIQRIQSKTTTTIGVVIGAETAVAAQATNVDCIAVHD